MTPGKTIALTRWTFVGKVMSLLFNMLSRLVITFLPRSKCLFFFFLQIESFIVGRFLFFLFNLILFLTLQYCIGFAIYQHESTTGIIISWLQSPSAVILEPPKIKSLTVSTVSPCICHEVMGLDAIILVFWMLSFKPTFSLSEFYQ